MKNTEKKLSIEEIEKAYPEADWWIKKLHQALAEERGRIDKEITRQFKYASEHNNYDMRGVDWQKIIHQTDLLSFLDKPLTDK